MNIAVQYADGAKMKEILLEAPIQQVLCSFDPAALHSLLSYLPGINTGNDSPAVVKQTICNDKEFYAKMNSIHPDTFKRMINALPDINFLFTYLDPSFSARIIQSANEVAIVNSHRSFLDNRNVVFHLYQEMPNIDSNYTSTLLDVNCGYIYYVMEDHYNLEYLIPYMDSKTLNYVIMCYPQLGEKMAAFNGYTLERVLRNIYHLIPFLKNLSDSTKSIYLWKVPSLGRIMPKTMSNDFAELKFIRNRIDEKNLAYLRSKVPQIDMILNRLNYYDLAALNSKMANIKKYVDTISSDDLERINSSIEFICAIWDNHGRTAVLRLLKHKVFDAGRPFFRLLL